MRAAFIPIVAAAATITPIVATTIKTNVPSLKVPACPAKGTVMYNKSVPAKTAFPLTQVDLCYADSTIDITFTAHEEINFFFNASHGTNDPIWAYEVMEAFIAAGTVDPQTYLEFEVSPNNVTFQAFIYNPSKVRASDSPMDAAFLQTPIADGLVAETILDRAEKKWISKAKIPLGLFNVDSGKAKGTKWRMNFFRTVTSPSSFPDQELGAWNPTDQPNFHMTPFFGNVQLV